MAAMSDIKIAKLARNEDLALSGLDKPATIKKLGLATVLNVEQTRELTGLEQQCVSYEIPYFDLDGKKLKHSRWKIISVSDDIPLKYYQEPKTIPRLYFPALVDWRKIATDSGQRIIITEGEKKAAKACLDGMPALGLGGVWNWKSKKWAMPEIKDFDWIEWRGREVEVCYDADLSENENVARALAALCGMLAKRGARVFIRYLPSVEGCDSLDEFLVNKSVKAYLDLACHEADFSREMQQFNDDLMYVKRIQSYYSTYEQIVYPTYLRLQQRYGDIKVMSESGKPTPAIKEWSEWPHRRMVDSFTYEPGRPRIVDDMYNEWHAWGMEPKKGDCKQFLEVVKSIDDWPWLLKWLAYPLQYPGTKMYTSVVIWSPETGTGKTFIGSVMQDLYGPENTSTITSDDLHDERKAWAKNKAFVLGEEVSSAYYKSDTGRLKNLITGKTITINEKYEKPYDIRNTVNFMFTSNNPDAMKIERQDRRYWVGRLDGGRSAAFWTKLDKWRRDGGAAHFMHYLLHNVDCSKFNPRDKAPETAEKEHMIYSSMTDIEQWVHNFLLDPEQAFGDMATTIKGQELFTVKSLVGLASGALNDVKVSPQRLGIALSNAGVIKPTGGTVRLGTARTERLFAARNMEYWKTKINDPAAWAAHYNKMNLQIDEVSARRMAKRSKT